MANDLMQKVPERKRRSAAATFIIRLVKQKPLGMVGGVIVLLMLLVGIFADLIAPYGMNEIHPGEGMISPSAKYWLGTDNLGRDMLSLVIFGARISIIVGLAASTIATFLSVIIGMLCGFFGGKFDLLVQRLVDAWMCFPGLIILMVIISIVGPGLWQVTLVLSLQFGIAGSRIIRGAVIGIKQNVYIEAARAIGSSNTRILFRHILPNIMAPIIILFSTRVPSVILSEASLSFLGFGIPPPTPSWGGMLSGSGRIICLWRRGWLYGQVLPLVL
jgi:peptide/nickel transport system permease protein